MRQVLLAVVLVLSYAHTAFAWGTKGHEVVAYIAYQHLDATTRKQVDDLMALNPCFAEWQAAVASLPAEQQAVGIFMLGATWPDKIKMNPHGTPYACQPGHKFIFDGGVPASGVGVSEDVPPATPEASQNIGYGDTRRHKYWHFIDTPFSPDGTNLELANTPNALTQLMTLAKALHSDEGDDLKSYDMVWIEHLVGDLHQPLHDTSRFTAAHPNGDAGGNSILVCETAGCKAELHAFWDELPGPGNDLPAAIALGQELNAGTGPSDDTIEIENPSDWASQGFLLAKTVVYASPITDDAPGSTPRRPDAAYTAKARETMRAQLLLGGYRLAEVLNDYLG